MKKVKVPVWRVALILLAVVFVSTHMAAGLSAKYSTKIGASGSFSTAKFSGGSVDVTGDGSVNVSEATKSGYHVFETECKVEFGACEVSRQFSLTLSTEDDTITFICPDANSTPLYSVKSCNGSSEFAASDTGYGSALSAGHAYVGIAETTSNTDASYTWTAIDMSGAVGGQSITAISNQSIDMSVHTYKVKVIYFRNLSSSTKSGDVDIAFSLNCEQVD